MRIVVTNDDGIDSIGIRKLIEGISALGEIYVVAPDRKLIGVGGGVTFDRPVKVDRVSLGLGEREAFKTYGTPADCVILALDLLVRDVDIIISGINDEPNVGDDIRLSGTIGACREAAFSGIKAFGVSIEYGKDSIYFDGAVEISKALIKGIERYSLPQGIFLNVNVPNVPKEEIKGVRFVKLGRRRYIDRVKKVLDPYGREYYWIGGRLIDDLEEDTENDALRKNFIAITPISIDETDYESLEVMKKWEIEF
jgi:5'-nucleotidase